MRTFWELRRSNPGEFWFRCLFWSFWTHLALFIVSYTFRDVVPLISAVFLAMYYRCRWHESVLRRLPVLHLFGCLWGMLLIGIVFSSNPGASFLEVAIAANKGLLLPFLGMECVRNRKDLQRLAWACALAFCWVGLDGIYQYYTGVDAIWGYTPNGGRLTSVMDDYEVGNYMVQALIPACGVWYILRSRLSLLPASLITATLFLPGFFTIWGACVRSSLLALGVSSVVWLYARRTISLRRLALACALAVTLLVIITQSFDLFRLSFKTVALDGRWSLWQLGWNVFMAHPVFGAGIDMYNSAFRELGMVPAKDAITISHPHNMYLDILCSTGVAGAAFGYTFLLGMLVWQARHLLPRLSCNWVPPAHEDSDTPGCSRLYWILTGLFGLGWLTWMVEGIFGHELLRVWWFGHAMLGLGVTIGAVVRGLDGEKASRAGLDV